MMAKAFISGVFCLALFYLMDVWYLVQKERRYEEKMVLAPPCGTCIVHWSGPACFVGFSGPTLLYCVFSLPGQWKGLPGNCIPLWNYFSVTED